MSYYCIYEVDWLGWDLVEPLTYTIGQGLFVMGLLYSFRNLKNPSYSELHEDFKKRRLDRWYLKNGFDPDRLNFLKEELETIEKQIKIAENQRYA